MLLQLTRKIHHASEILKIDLQNICGINLETLVKKKKNNIYNDKLSHHDVGSAKEIAYS